jgi:hypothetical protein
VRVMDTLDPGNVVVSADGVCHWRLKIHGPPNEEDYMKMYGWFTLCYVNMNEWMRGQMTRSEDTRDVTCLMCLSSAYRRYT